MNQYYYEKPYAFLLQPALTDERYHLSILVVLEHFFADVDYELEAPDGSETRIVNLYLRQRGAHRSAYIPSKPPLIIDRYLANNGGDTEQEIWIRLFVEETAGAEMVLLSKLIVRFADANRTNSSTDLHPHLYIREDLIDHYELCGLLRTNGMFEFHQGNHSILQNRVVNDLREYSVKLDHLSSGGGPDFLAAKTMYETEDDDALVSVDLFVNNQATSSGKVRHDDADPKDNPYL